MAAPTLIRAAGALGGSVRTRRKRASRELTFVDLGAAAENPAHGPRITAPARLPAEVSAISARHLLVRKAQNGVRGTASAALPRGLLSP